MDEVSRTRELLDRVVVLKDRIDLELAAASDEAVVLVDFNRTADGGGTLSEAYAVAVAQKVQMGFAFDRATEERDRHQSGEYPHPQTALGDPGVYGWFAMRVEYAAYQAIDRTFDDAHAERLRGVQSERDARQASLLSTDLAMASVASWRAAATHFRASALGFAAVVREYKGIEARHASKVYLWD